MTQDTACEAMRARRMLAPENALGCFPGRAGFQGFGVGWGQSERVAVWRPGDSVAARDRRRRPLRRREWAQGGCTSAHTRGWSPTADPTESPHFPAFRTQNHFLCLAEGWRRRRRAGGGARGAAPAPPVCGARCHSALAPAAPEASPVSCIPGPGRPAPGALGIPELAAAGGVGLGGRSVGTLRWLGALPSLVTLGRSVFPSAPGAPRWGCSGGLKKATRMPPL